MTTSILILTLLGDDPATVRYFDGIGRTLDRTRFRLVLGTIRNPGAVQERMNALGHTTFCLNCRSRWDYPAAIWRLARLIRREQIDLLDGNEELAAFLCGFAGILSRRPVRIYHRHHDQSLPFRPDEGPQGNLVQRMATYLHGVNYRLLDGLAGLFAHRILTVSENHRQSVLQQHAGWGRKLGVTLNGVDIPVDLGGDAAKAREIRDELWKVAQAPILTLVARLNWRKGHPILFQALRQLKDCHGLEPHLLVVGYGPLEAELKALAEQLGVGRVRFVGMQSNVLPWFLAADLVVIPSLVEPFGLTAAEAMACSRPVVASRVGGLQEIVVDGETGLLVPPGEPGPLAGAIRQLLGNPERAPEMGRRGRERYALEFTQEAMTRRWESHYLDLLEARAARQEGAVA